MREAVPLILASRSPRRAELLRKIGLPFEVVPPEPVEENLDGSPLEVALKLATHKAISVGKRWQGRLVLGADTMVICGGEVLGKPNNDSEAEEMLVRLSGRRHAVITALALCRHSDDNPQLRTDWERTWVWFRPLSSDEIKEYIRSGEPKDKAGAYAIQGRGAIFIQKIEGCYFNVVGLPLSKLCEMLKAWGYHLFKELANVSTAND